MSAAVASCSTSSFAAAAAAAASATTTSAASLKAASRRKQQAPSPLLPSPEHTLSLRLACRRSHRSRSSQLGMASAPATEQRRGVTEAAVANDSKKRAKEFDTVAIHYIGKLDTGHVFASTRKTAQSASTKDRCFVFKLSDEHVMKDPMMKKFNEYVLGMSVGDKVQFTVPKSESYPYDRSLLLELPHSKLTEHLKVGDFASLPTGRNMRVARVTDKTVILDGNNPLAGKELHFDVELISIQEGLIE